MTQLVEKDPVHVVEEDNIVRPPHYNEVSGPQILTSDTARQAPKGSPVLYVLIGGLIAAGVAWWIVDMFVK